MKKANPFSLYTLILALALNAGCSSTTPIITISGTLETDDIDLIAPFSEEILTIRFSEGTRISIGDTLAILDTTIVVAKIAAARAAYRQAQSQLKDLQAGSDKEKIRAAVARLSQATATAKQATADLERATKLHQHELLEDQALEQAQLFNSNSKSAVTVAEQVLADLNRGARINQINAAQSAQKRAEAELAASIRNYSNAFLISKHNGVIQILPYQIGERVPAGRTIITLRDPNNLWVNIYIPESNLADVQIGDSLSFSVDAYPERSFSGEVTYISSEAEFTPRNVQSPEERVNLVFAVKVRVTTEQSDLRAGMPADFTLK